MKHTITEIVKGTKVKFHSFDCNTNKFNYTVKLEDGTVYLFPVDRDDVGSATMLAEDKGLIFMRWIRKSIKDNSIFEVDEINLTGEFIFSSYRAGFIYYKKDECDYVVDVNEIKDGKIFLSTEDSTLQQWIQQIQTQHNLSED